MWKSSHVQRIRHPLLSHNRHAFSQAIMIFKEATLANGQSIGLATLSGTVLDPSGSTGAPGKKGGFWLLDKEGKESFVRAIGLGIAVRPGHRVSLVYGAPSAQVEGALFGAMNHSTGEAACDIMKLGKALRTWRLDVAEGKSFLIWALVPCLVLALFAFASPSARLDTRMFATFWSAVGGFILGSIAWYFIGFRMGPQARFEELAAQINAHGVAALHQASD